MSPVQKKSSAKKNASVDKLLENNGVRINKYIADSGICSRRKAEEYIREGRVKVNRRPTIDLATKIMPGDFVTIDGEPVSDVRRFVYILLNKPKDYLTTNSDELGRKTVFDLVRSEKRIFSVGRLDRNTTGVLLLTNDGELSYRLMHPKYQISRVYSVTLDKPIVPAHAKEISRGVELEDGETSPCELFIDPKDYHRVLVELKEGKNREVRRIFELFGYDVKKLDRKSYHSLTSRGLSRGEYRHLTRGEVSELYRAAAL